jgi:methylase of polypeptide subunit release factors
MSGAVTRPAFESLAKAFERNVVFQYIHPYELYRKWLEAVWAFLDAVHDQEGFRQCLDRQTREQGEEFGRLFGIYTDAVEAEPFRDILGELFMRLDVKSAATGQYFSPMCVAEMMARMTFDRAEFERLVQEKGSVSVCDPAVGSGVMLLAYAKIVHAEFGRWGTSKLRLYGTDIDQRCVHMCRIQLRMNGLDAFGRMAALLAQQVPDVTLNAGQLALPGIAA